MNPLSTLRASALTLTDAVVRAQHLQWLHGARPEECDDARLADAVALCRARLAQLRGTGDLLERLLDGMTAPVEAT